MKVLWVITLVFLLISSLELKAEPAKIIITMQDDVYKDYLCLLNGRSPLEVTDYSGKCSRRDVVEIVLFQQVLALGGLSANFTFVGGNHSLRNKRLLETGFLLGSVDTFWLQDAKETDFLLISKPMILAGEYTAGIFTTKKNMHLLASKSLKDLQQFTGVSSKNWTADWAAMQGLGLKKLVDEPIWSAQISLVKKGFVDFMLAPLNVNFKEQEWDLVAVPKLAVLLNDSRHFVFSKHHPQASVALEAANKGIAIMRENGMIHKAYSEAQMFYAVEHGYHIINQ